jgi:hypothetical protein
MIVDTYVGIECLRLIYTPKVVVTWGKLGSLEPWSFIPYIKFRSIFNFGVYFVKSYHSVSILASPYPSFPINSLSH